MNVGAMGFVEFLGMCVMVALEMGNEVVLERGGQIVSGVLVVVEGVVGM